MVPVWLRTNCGTPFTFCEISVGCPLRRSFQPESNFSPSEIFPVVVTVPSDPMGPEGTVEIFPSAAIMATRGLAASTRQIIPDEVAELRVNPPMPSIVRTRFGSAGFFTKRYLMP